MFKARKMYPIFTIFQLPVPTEQDVYFSSLMFRIFSSSKGALSVALLPPPPPVTVGSAGYLGRH